MDLKNGELEASLTGSIPTYQASASDCELCPIDLNKLYNEQVGTGVLLLTRGVTTTRMLTSESLICVRV